MGLAYILCGPPPVEVKDAYAADYSADDGKKWSEMDGGEKAKHVASVLLKLAVVLGSLYLFICSLSFLANGFRLVAGRQAGEVFRNNVIFDNPIAGVLVGVLVTVLVQSSSTSTSIVITMVAADLFTVRQAISLIMGANIGTSVTSTIVALGQAGEKEEFRKAFAAATVHDMFNFCNVLILLPLEAISGYLFHLSSAFIPDDLKKGTKPPDFLKVITKPFTKVVMSVDKKLITKIAAAEDEEELAELSKKKLLKHFFGNKTMDDTAAGIVCLIFALALLCITLALIVGTLKSLLKGQIRKVLHKTINGNIPDLGPIPMGWAAGYLAMGGGLVMTILVQSSSITTSVLTPLVGVGVIQIERMYPSVLGANIGTTVTGVLAALAADESKLALTLQVAYAHLLFNITGIFVWYIFWPLRAIPLNAAKYLGNTTAEYRWFALLYLFLAFFLFPLIIFGISLGSNAASVTIVLLGVFIAIVIAIINWMQVHKPESLPVTLRDWSFLPEFMRSLAPMDRVLCGPCNKMLKKDGDTSTAVQKGEA